MAYYWTAFNWDDYERKTAHLTMTEDGAYRRLIAHYYRTGKPLPANAELLLRVCRAFADDEKAAVLKVLDEFFTLEVDGYHNRRCDEELAKHTQISEKRRDAGRKGAESTNNKRAANAPANERQMPTQSQLHIKPIVLTPAFTLPVWVPEKAWNDYLAMRDKSRKPMTVRAKELAVQKLEALMNGGHDPEAVLNQSVMNSYLGLFPIHEVSSGANQRNRPERISAATARNERNADAIANVARKIGIDPAMASARSAAAQGGTDGGGHRILAAEPVVILPPRN